MALTCPGTITTGSNGEALCSVGWVDQPLPVLDLSPVETLNATLEYLFTWDPELFGLVLFASAMLFTTGWGAGVCMRKLTAR